VKQRQGKMPTQVQLEHLWQGEVQWHWVARMYGDEAGRQFIDCHGEVVNCSSQAVDGLKNWGKHILDPGCCEFVGVV